ncbi:ADP-ribosylglycohydrolase family protein [Aureivirga sp. CE67]|uniref:ADP-ribosylglycohydrolase family protein n=1 Tax=Aureivirga sp. CE67 TaxID=1788983 RepID=UPI0018CB6A59|nr:ADP-ribosylglycohydrolase family protein [Aureivirga sp. CE67]
MLLKGAIGDAYGAGFEFAESSKILEKNKVTTYETHPLFPEICGKYTDDTQMSIALAELILSNKEWNSLNIAEAFVNTFKRDPRRGYAKRFYSFLSEINSGQEFLDKIINKSNRNGAAMRAYVLGVFPSENEIIEKCTIQAEVTHQTEEAILAANAVALISHYFLYQKGNRKDLLEYLNDIQKYNWKGMWNQEVGMNGIETFEATLAIVLNDSSLKNKLQKSVTFGGDVDTVASLSLALSSLDNSIENDLPHFLYDNLENGDFGRDYINELDLKLNDFFEQNRIK